MKSAIFLSAVALATVLSAQALHAQTIAGSSASVSGLSYRLVDLDLGDGITPWITFNQNYLVIGTDANYKPQVSVPTGDPFSAAPETVIADGLLASNDGGIRTSAQLSSQNVQNLTVDTRSDITGVYYNGAVVFSAYGGGVSEGNPFPADGSFSWTLSPHTALVIEGRAQASAQVDLSKLAQGTLLQGAQNNAYGLQLDSYGSFSAQLLANASFSSVTGDLLPELNDSIDVSAEAHQGVNRDGLVLGEGELLNDTALQAFSIQVANESAEARGGVLSLYTGSQNSITFTPALTSEVPQVPGIPEPGTCALMALGLGLMTWQVKTARRT